MDYADARITIASITWNTQVCVVKMNVMTANISCHKNRRVSDDIWRIDVGNPSLGNSGY